MGTPSKFMFKRFALLVAMIKLVIQFCPFCGMWQKRPQNENECPIWGCTSFSRHEIFKANLPKEKSASCGQLSTPLLIVEQTMETKAQHYSLHNIKKYQDDLLQSKDNRGLVYQSFVLVWRSSVAAVFFWEGISNFTIIQLSSPRNLIPSIFPA